MKNKQKIIAILGLPASGKTEVIEYLMKKYNWPKVYFGSVTFDEMRNRKLETNEKNERFVREDLRKKFGRLHYARQIIKKINKLKNEKIILVESLYDWDEYLLFKKRFGINFLTIGIYASPEIRYKRLEKRKIRPLNNKDAQSRDYAQIENLFQAGPIAMAEYAIINEGTKKHLFSQVDAVLKKMKQ